jgi:hypothetical protein
MTKATRGKLSSWLAAVAYVAAVASSLTFWLGGWWLGGWVWLGALATLLVVGAVLASWKRGIISLPAVLIALASPTAFIIAFWDSGLG